MRQSRFCLPGLAWLLLLAVSFTARAGEVSVPDLPLPGDGKTPTFMQYLDTHAVKAKEAKHLAGATAKGDVTYSVPIALPPAILQPSLSLNYSSEAGLNQEISQGWSLGGIAEIRRPVSRAFTLKSKANWFGAEWIFSGPDFGGTLIPSGNDDYKFYLRTSNAQLVKAEYDATTNVWKVYSNGFTWVLTAQDAGENTESGTALWRVANVYDSTSARNRVTYCYHDSGAIRAILYGGHDEGNGDDDLISVVFHYGNNATKRTSARDGFLTTYSEHVEKIVINRRTNPDETCDDLGRDNTLSIADAKLDTLGDSETRLYAFDLVYTSDDSTDLLTSLEREGKQSSEAETIAKFSYTELSTSAKAASAGTAMAPAALGSTNSAPDGTTAQGSLSRTDSVLLDFNRDGLADQVTISPSSGATTQWHVKNQKVNYSKRSFSWAGAWEVIAKTEALGTTYTPRPDTSEPYTESYARTELVDFDGDGYPDILVSDDEDEWMVYYGNPDHHYSATNASQEKPPLVAKGYRVTNSRTNRAIRADHAKASEHTGDAVAGLIDFNGDGWLDFYAPAEGEVFLHAGKKEGGWPEKITLTQKFEALRSVRYTIKRDFLLLNFKEVCEEMCEQSCEDSVAAAVSTCIEECEDENNTGEDCDKSCEDNNDVGSCVRDSCGECGNTDQEQYFVTATDEFGAFYDLNGDGLQDYVNSSATPWKVSLNNGHDFEAPVNWRAPLEYTRRSDEGKPTIHFESEDLDDKLMDGEPSRVTQMLLDVDGDGLTDLALGKDHGKVWYKNTGSGFEKKSRALPAWWPDDFMTAESETVMDGDSGTSESNTKTTALVTDLNHDGVLDAVSASKVSYGHFPKPYLLRSVDNNRGGQTEISYRSLATVSPSGDWSEEQYTPNVRTLVDTIASTDTITAQKAKTSFEYADGFYENGLFQGLKSRASDREINGAWTSRSADTHELDRDYGPLVKKRDLYTDAGLSFGDKIKKGSLAEKLRAETEISYGDYGDDGRKQFRLPQKRKVTLHGESKGSEAVTLSYDWDDFGNLSSYKHDGGGDAAAMTVVDMQYTADNARKQDARCFRMKKKTVYATDPLTGKYGAVAHEDYFYDGASDTDAVLSRGLLTKSSAWAGWTAGGESLSADTIVLAYERGSRGEILSATDEATGHSVSQTFGFGGAVVLTQTNALGHTVTRELDDQGRVTKITDPNGLSVVTTYDAFGRVTKSAATDRYGKSAALKEFVFSWESAPHHTATKIYNDGGLERTGHAVEDGFGNVAQTWIEDATGTYYKTSILHDLNGQQLQTSHPKKVLTAFAAPKTIGVSESETFARRYYDALGTPRETVADAATNNGAALVYQDAPRVMLAQDEEGYQTELTYDAHARIIQVRQGKSGNLETTAAYAYDGMDRVVKFTDGGGTYYTYSYDGAGRLRRVGHGTSLTTSAASAAKTASVAATAKTKSSSTAKTLSSVSGAKITGKDSTWYAYEYKGLLKTKMTDAAGGWTAWKYDKLGRVTKITASDSLPSSAGTLEYAFTYDGNWIGAVSETTDPSGSTTFAYDEWGRPKQTQRTYAESSLAKKTQAVFSFDHDLLGNLVAKTYPSGRVVTNTYKYGFLTRQSSASGGKTDYSLSNGYNQWGLLSSVTSSLGHSYTYGYSTPLYPDGIAFKAGSSDYSRAYSWYKNSLLKEKTATNAAVAVSSGALASTSATSGAVAKTTAVKSKTKSSTTTSASTSSSSTSSSGGIKTKYAYSYDDLRQISRLTSTGKTVESYVYDAAGNLKTMLDHDGATWTYASPGALNRIASRSSDKSGAETYEYDAAGRVTAWKDSDGTHGLVYDGLGRVRGEQLNGAWKAVFDYDADGNLVRRADNNPFTAKPYYVYSFDAWRYDEKNKTVTEFESPFVANDNGSRRWFLRDYDGGAVMGFEDGGARVFAREFGAYGVDIASSGTAWNWQAFHGMEDQGALIHMGQRHLIQKDGRWAQPEPLLYLGLSTEKLAEPLAVSTHRYADNRPTLFTDPTGFDTEILKGDDVSVWTYGSRGESPMNGYKEDAANGKSQFYVYNDILADISGVNPNGGDMNCVSVAIATDLLLSGQPAYAGNHSSKTGKEINGADEVDLLNFYRGIDIMSVSNEADIEFVMRDAGSGSRAVMYGFTDEGYFHVINVVNVEGKIYFIDGQSGGRADMSIYQFKDDPFTATIDENAKLIITHDVANSEKYGAD